MSNAGVWVGGIILAFAAMIFWQSLSFDYYSGSGPGPGMFPLWISGILIILSVLHIWSSVKKDLIKLTDILPKERELGNVLSIIGSLILFIILVPYTGYVIASIMMLFLLLVREFKWYWGLGISGTVTLVLFFVFQMLLNVPLPVNAFGW